MITSTLQDQMYCNSLTRYSRFKTHEVNIGGVPLGGDNPIRIQSMTTADTMNTEATVEETIRLIEAGCDYVRITAPSKRDAENLAQIKKLIRKAGYDTPLIADIHFTPNAAEIAARIVEKVRVNPGNYADKKKFQVFEYTDAQYQAELDRLYEKFSPLVKICKEEGTAMRIGTNHGSLSDRIMSRYGDTPLGMVESAMEFLRICEDHNYYDVVLSMKASNPQVMVQAYRLLVNEMMKENMAYPLHLGVTEAGDGEDGRIKSAVGIGTLLEDGLGDTIRVSLTEDPVAEVPVARELVARYALRAARKQDEIEPVRNLPIDPYSYEKRDSLPTGNIGKDNVPVVLANLSEIERDNPLQLQPYGYKYDLLLDKWHIADMSVDYVYLGEKDFEYEIPGTLKKIFDYHAWRDSDRKGFPLYKLETYLEAEERSSMLNFVELSLADIDEALLARLKQDETACLVLYTENEHAMPELRRAFIKFIENEVQNPVIINRNYGNVSDEQFLLYSATDLGGLFIDGMGDGVWLEGEGQSPQLVTSASFGILQATRTRISKTEYISCPSCGRTLFDLQETTNMIRNATNHLKGVKIGIMGCIVNGPGEMADADYGYVGSGPGKITLYRGKEVVKSKIPAADALDELINLIKEDGNWVEEREGQEV